MEQNAAPDQPICDTHQAGLSVVAGLSLDLGTEILDTVDQCHTYRLNVGLSFIAFLGPSGAGPFRTDQPGAGAVGQAKQPSSSDITLTGPKPARRVG